MNGSLFYVCHLREVNPVSILILHRFDTGSTAIDVLTDQACLDEYLRTATYGSESITIARGIVAERQCSETGTIDVLAGKLAVGFHVGISSNIAGETATVDGLEREARQTECPCQATDTVALVGLRVFIAAIGTTIIAHLFFLGKLCEIFKELLLEGNVGIIVLGLVEVTVGYSSHFQDTLVANLAARLGIDLGLSHLGIGTISGSED